MSVRLEVTRKAELGVRALAALLPAGTRRKASELAGQLDTTPGFLAQVMTPLVRAGWVGSVPGPTGGYVATTSDVSVLQVIEAVDGPTSTGRCVVADAPCDGRTPCVLHAAWKAARAALTDTLAATPVAATTAKENR